MKICVCVNHYYPSVGGAEIVAQAIVDYLAQHHEVYVLTRKLAKKKRDSKDFPYRVFEYRVGELEAVGQKLKSLNPDVVLIYSDVFDFFRPLATRPQPFKLILALCGANWLYGNRNYVNLLYRNLDNIHAFVCHSEYERDYRLCSTERFAAKTHVIPNGIWTEEFDKNSLTRHDLCADVADRRWLLNVSNFFPGKGQEHLLDIIGRLPNPEQIAYLQVSSDIDFDVGSQLEARWRMRSRELSEKGVKVKLLKNRCREEVVGFFKQSNVFVFPSEKEVAPLVLLESMASSLPWIASDVGNAKGLRGGIAVHSMKDRRFHSVFNEQIKEGFVKGIQKLWNTPKLGESGRCQIEDELTWDKVLPQYLKLVESI